MTQAKFLTLSYRLCYNLLWVVTPKIELNTKQTVVKNEHFTAVFLYSKPERKWQKWQIETAPIQCNFISVMMSSTNNKAYGEGMVDIITSYDAAILP